MNEINRRRLEVTSVFLKIGALGAIGVTIIQLLPHAAPDLFTGLLVALTVIALAAWRLPVLSVVVGGGLIGIVARSKLVHRLIS